MPADLDNQSPEMDQEMGADAPADMGADPGAEGHGDQEGAMAKQELIKLANYATNLQEHIEDGEELEAWVQSKITIAATNIASVYHYLAYEKKIGEYGDKLDSVPMSESKKLAIKNWLMEAKAKVKELKKAQVEKVKEGQSDLKKSGDSFKTRTGVATKTSTGIKHTNTSHSDEEHGEPASNVKARSAADKAGEKAADKASEKESKAWGKANPGKQHIYKDGKKVNEAKGKKPEWLEKAEVEAELKSGAKVSPAEKKKVGVKEGAMSAGEKAHHHAMEYAKHHKSGNLELAMHHREACEECGGSIKHGAMGECFHSHPHLNHGQMYECNTTPGAVMAPVAEGKSKCTCESTGKSKCSVHGKMDEGKKAKPDFLDMDGDGNKKEPMKKAIKDKAMKEAAPRGQRSQDSAIKVAQIGKSKSPGANLKQGAEDALEKGNHKKIDQIHQYATTTTPTGRAKKVSEAKPSAGLSAAKKSAVVKAAKKGEDIGKPGKGFKALAKKAGGGEKGEKIAAAAMWKNIKETTAYLAEKKKKEKMTDENLTVVPNPSGAKDAEEAKKLGAAMPAPAGKKDPISESVDRMRELTSRLNRAEKPMVAESREVDQIRALTKRLLG